MDVSDHPRPRPDLVPFAGLAEDVDLVAVDKAADSSVFDTGAGAYVQAGNRNTTKFLGRISGNNAGCKSD